MSHVLCSKPSSVTWRCAGHPQQESTTSSYFQGTDKEPPCQDIRVAIVAQTFCHKGWGINKQAIVSYQKPGCLKELFRGQSVVLSSSSVFGAFAVSDLATTAWLNSTTPLHIASGVGLVYNSSGSIPCTPGPSGNCFGLMVAANCANDKSCLRCT